MAKDIDGSMVRKVAKEIEALEGEKAEAGQALSMKLSDAKRMGLNIPIFTRARRDAKKGKMQRELERAAYEGYMMMLGANDGNPLSPTTKKWIDNKDPYGDKDPNQSDIDDFLPPVVDQKALDAAKAAAEKASVTPEIAYAMGCKAKADGFSMIQNPFGFIMGREDSGLLNAEWERGWLSTTGSDGMDIPPSLQRKSAKKKKDDGDDDARKGAAPAKSSGTNGHDADARGA
jgi:uncharacterized protein (UPF0335 family)